MVRFTNCFFGFLNVATIVLSIPILGGGIWLVTKANTDCDEESVEWAVICIGALLMLVSLAGLVGVCCKVRWLLWVYLCAMFVIILLLFCSTVFTFVVGTGDSKWLRKRVHNASNWRKTKGCILDDEICKNLAKDSVHESAKQFFRKKLSHIESGCCKPPTSCGFTYVNATYWVPSATSANTSDPDCVTWSNAQEKLCYECRSCKAGEVARMKKGWRRDAIIDAVVLVALVVVDAIGCCAFRNVRREKSHDMPLI